MIHALDAMQLLPDSVHTGSSQSVRTRFCHSDGKPTFFSLERSKSSFPPETAILSVENNFFKTIVNCSEMIERLAWF